MTVFGNWIGSDDFKEPRGRFVVAAGASSASVTLSQANNGGYRPQLVSITAVGADIRWNWNAAASATTYYIKSGDTIKMRVPYIDDDPTLHALRNASTDGTLEIITWEEQS